MERRLVVILAADVVGYTTLMGNDEEGTHSTLTRLIDELISPLIANHNGRLVKLIGDGVLAEFGSVIDAVTCAITWQDKIKVENTPIQFRIGINLGEIIVKNGDIFGNGVNVAARLEALANSGGICVSDDVFRQAKGKVEAVFHDMGEQQLKNVAEPIRTYSIGSQGIARPGESANTFRRDLALPNKPSIAVLPFDNMSGDPEQNYFADGIVEDIITAFSRNRALFVIARNSSFSYRGKAVDIKQIGRELGVRYVLEGSVRKSGNRIRINGQLIDASTGSHLWADRFDGEEVDIFDLQDQITQNVVGTIAPRLELAEIERIRHKPTEILDAYDCYLRGMEAFHQFTVEANQNAMAHFSRAFELDPQYAAAYGMASRTYGQRKGFGWVNDLEQEAAEAIRLARIAASLGRDDATALAAAGFTLILYGEAVDGDAFLDQALVVNPNLAWAWHTSGLSKAITGKPWLSVERATHAMRLNPQDPQQFAMQSALALGHYLLGNDDEAFVWSEAALRENPKFLIAATVNTASAAQLDRAEDVQKAMTRLRQLDPDRRLSNLDDFLAFQRSQDAERWQDGLRKAGLPE